MTTKLKRLWHRASLRNPNETSKRWLRERTFTDYTEDPNASNGSFDKVTLLKKSLTDAGAHGLICSLTNRLNRQSLLLCWHQTSGKLLEDDRSHRHISPQELCAFASVAVDPTLGNCSARVYCIKVDSSSNSTSVELPRPSYSTRSQESLTTIGEASIQEDLTMNGGHGLIQDGASGHGESPMNGSLKSPVTKPREDRFELYLLVHWALASGDRPCYTAEWAITPVGASVPDWQVWQTFADQLLLDCCPQGTTAMRRTPPNLFGHRNNLVLAAYMTPDDTAPVMVMDVKEQQTGSVGSMAARSMATRQSIFDMPHLEYGSVLPAVTVVLENQMEGVSLTQGSTMALRCSCPSADTWQTTVAPEQCISASYSPQEDTRAAAAMLLFSMDQPCGPWLRDRPTIAILWRIRNDTAHAYMMAAECSRWDALVLDTHLEISLPTANKSPNRHSGPRSDARQTSQRIPLDETAQSQVSLELSWHAEEGIRLQIVMSHNARSFTI
ncbi:hypothetical protein BDF19DRAFT_24742 [Syncephalis fuscata]|nr:hypothetical protein BDF19DRAFT_24742 [Syncephalis fuscata]